MQDAEELEAYRASFGFSADEIITTQQYVEISDVMDHSFTMTPFTSNQPNQEESVEAASKGESQKAQTTQMNLPSLKLKSDTICSEVPFSCDRLEGKPLLPVAILRYSLFHSHKSGERRKENLNPNSPVTCSPTQVFVISFTLKVSHAEQPL